jgi:hypothetical protein
MQMGSSPRPGRQSPTPEPPGAARAHFDRPSGQTLAATGEPGVAQDVPDQGDDLTPCPLRGWGSERLEMHYTLRLGQAKIVVPLAPVKTGISRSLVNSQLRSSGHIRAPKGTDSPS